MSDKRQPGVLGSLPRTRPHRRSDKRPAAAAPASVPTAQSGTASTATPATKTRAATKPKAAGKPKPRAAAREPASPLPPARAPGAMETAVQAAAELAEIGLGASARALRRTLSRLPRP